jgi:hypothetical protein
LTNFANFAGAIFAGDIFAGANFVGAAFTIFANLGAALITGGDFFGAIVFLGLLGLTGLLALRGFADFFMDLTIFLRAGVDRLLLLDLATEVAFPFRLERTTRIGY